MLVGIIIFKTEFLYKNFWDSSWEGWTQEVFSSPSQALLWNDLSKLSIYGALQELLM